MNTKRKFWDELFKNALTVGDFQVEEINDTWTLRRIGSDIPYDLFGTQQEAVTFAVRKSRNHLPQ